MPLNEMSKAALADHLPLLLEGVHAKRHSWHVAMDWETGLCHVRLTRLVREGDVEAEHRYVLRLSFDYYPLEQPGAIFVDPNTREIGSSDNFERWWPNVDGNPWINIQINTGEPAKSYLCFQWTQEFKQTHSAPELTDPKRWDPKKHNVVGVVSRVQQALSSSFYKGYRKQ